MTELLKELEAVALLADRLDQLSDAVAAQRWNEFSMRVPAEPHRDADLVLASIARFLRTHHAEIADMATRMEVVERTLQRCKQTLDTTSECWRLDAERLEAAERDAARYRWLRDKSLGQWEDHPICVSQERSPLGMRYVAPLIGGSLDTAIDAAMHNSAREDGE